METTACASSSRTARWANVSFGDEEWTDVFEPLRDPARFAKVIVEGGTIVWPDQGLDMAPEPLYEEARRNAVKAAPNSV